MKKNEAKQAVELLSYRCRSIEIVSTATIGFYIRCEWIEGDESCFFKFEDAKRNHDDYLNRLAVFILSKRIPNQAK